MSRSPITIDVDRLRDALPPRGHQPMFARSGADFSVQSRAGVTEIDLYDEIGAYGVSAANFRRQLLSVDGDVTVRINSPGGDVFDGIAMHNDLAGHPGKVRVEITGLAASAASVIAMAGDEIVMAENAFMMIHNAWGVVIGNRHEARQYADLLEAIDASLARTYAHRSGQPLAAIKAMMDAETWLSAAQAQTKGLITGQAQPRESRARFDLSRYQNAPQQLHWSGSMELSKPRELENLLRSTGMPRVAARNITNGGWRGLTNEKPDDSELQHFASRMRAAFGDLKTTLKG